LNEPIQVSADVIEKYSNIVDIVGKFKEFNPQMTDINAFQALIKMGMPIELSSLVCSTNSINTLSDKTDLAKFLKGQKLKTSNGPSMDDENTDMGESVVGYKVSSKTFLKENSSLSKTLKKVYETLSDQSKNTKELKESIYRSKKEYLNESSK